MKQESVNSIKDTANYDWIVESDTRAWHESYYAAQALRDHQAKGIPNLYLKILEHMKSRYGIRTDKHIILDPMCGIGTTLIISNLNQMESIGIELEDKYFNDMVGYDYTFNGIDMGNDSLFAVSDIEMKQHIEGNLERFAKVTGRLQDGVPMYCKLVGENEIEYLNTPAYYYGGSHPITIFNHDSTKPFDKLIRDYISLESKVPIVITSPPYTRITEHDEKQIASLPKEKMHHHKPAGYENPNNIAMKMPHEYRMAMGEVYQNVYDFGVELCVIVTRDFIDKGKVFALWAWNKERLEWQHKYELIEHIKAKIPDMSLFKSMNYNRFHKAKGLPLIDWEDICIYKRR